MTTFSNEIANDAGLLREYIAVRFGSNLTYGGTVEARARAIRLAKRLAKMIGSTVEEVIATAQADYADYTAISE